jgi:hypothetical protein
MMDDAWEELRNKFDFALRNMVKDSEDARDTILDNFRNEREANPTAVFTEGWSVISDAFKEAKY